MAPQTKRKAAAIETRTAVFSTDFGWFCVAMQAGRVSELTFGHDTPDQAVMALKIASAPPDRPAVELRKIISRLQRFSRRAEDDFLDVPLNLDGYTPFQLAVVQQCRLIGVGRTCSYGELARAAGYPGAARAVGQVMATNRFPLIVPCHRVLASGGSLGGYSARHGLTLKRRLLEHEARSVGEGAGSREQGAWGMEHGAGNGC